MIGSSINTAAPMMPTSLSSGQLSQLANQTQSTSNISSNLLSLSTTVQQFDSIRKWLVKNHKKVSPHVQ